MPLVIHNCLKISNNFSTILVHKIALEKELKFRDRGCLKSVAITLYLQDSFLISIPIIIFFYKGFLRQV